MSATLTPAFDMKRFLSTGLLIMATLLAYRLFPADANMDESLQAGVLGIVFLLCLPILYVIFVEKEPLSSIGFQGSVKKYGFLTAVVAVIPFLVIWYAVFVIGGTDVAYSLPGFVQDSFLYFVLYEVVLVGLASFMFEVFFRGLIMLSWLSKTGIFAVFLQGGIFVAFLAAFGGIGWNSMPMILAAFASGFVAHRTRSVYYSWFSGWLTLFLADVVFLVLGR